MTMAADISESLRKVETETLSALRHRKIFITGASGFFGKWLLESIQVLNAQWDCQIEALAVVRRPAEFLQKNPHLKDSAIRLLPININSPYEIPEPISDTIHAATGGGLDPQDPSNHLATNIVHGTHNTLLATQNAGCKRFLFVSSGGIYGTQPTTLETVDESYTGGHESMAASYREIYGLSKRLAESLCTNFADSTDLTICSARCFAFTGPHLALDANFAIGNFISNALEGKPIQILGDGTPLRSYLYMSDLVGWLWTLLVKGSNKTAYNVGSDQPFSIAQLAHRVKAVVNPEVEVSVALQPNPQSPPARYIPNIDRARALGLDVWTDLDTAIEKTANWARQREKS